MLPVVNDVFGLFGFLFRFYGFTTECIENTEPF
jgi:hypothetical protein